MKNNTTLRIGLVAAASFLAACSEQASETSEQEATAKTVASVASKYSAEVVRTSYGIPHITAADFGSLGYGEGYVAAEDHVCNIAEVITKVRGELSEYQGPGKDNKNFISDVVMRGLGIPSQAQENFAAQTDIDKEWIVGYTAGYNRYIREKGKDGITSWCKGEDWVREVTPQDMLTRGVAITQTLPRIAGMVAGAQPLASETIKTSEIKITPALYAEAEGGMRMEGMGSNGWALGKDLTQNGRGMLLGNPHYPWIGPDRFWEKHLTIPGKLDVYGVALVGIPGVAIGFNKNVGWTHTVSASQRIVIYKLDLVPGDPTSYLYDGEPRKMTSRTVTVKINTGAGEPITKEHTVWFSHYGPMVTMPGLEWTDKVAFTARDANEHNVNGFAQWRAMGQAQNMDELKDAHRKWNAMPWVNTMATSSDGRAVFLDGSSVGNLSNEAIALWRERVKTDPLTGGLFAKRGLTLLDGSDSRFEWQSHPESVMEGVVPFVNKPQQDRTDYIFNANDSYWVTNASELLTGYSPLYGTVGEPRSLRTRMNALLLSEEGSNSFAGEDGKFTIQEMKDALFSNRSLASELLKDELVAACREAGTAMGDDKKVDLTEACDVLDAFNGQLDLDSKGAVLFREWITSFTYNETKNGKLYAVQFDAADPVNTPRGMGDKAYAIEKLAQAVIIMQESGLPLDAPLGAVQFAYRGDEKIAIHGGGGHEGIANIIGSRGNLDKHVFTVEAKKVGKSIGLTDKGYPVSGGSSFILGLTYTDDGPVAEAFLTYSQSGDPSSPHFTDQTKLFSEKKWRPALFNKSDIEKDVKSSMVLTGPR